MNNTLLIILLAICMLGGCNPDQKVVEYYDTGEVKSRLTLVDTTDGLSGQYKEYYKEDGALNMEGALRQGKRTGYWTYYHPDGTVKAEGKYLDGLKDGIWSYNVQDESYQIDWKIYSIPGEFKINIPQSWTIDEAEGLHMIASKEVDEEFSSNFNVSSVDAESIKDGLKSIAEDIIDQMLAEYSGFNPSVIKEEEIIINSNLAIVYTIEFKGNGITSLSYFVDASDSIYYLNFFTKKYEEDKLLFREIALSFNAF